MDSRSYFLVFIFVLVVLTRIEIVENARILCVVPSTSYSHQVVFRPLWKALAERGHQLTLLTTDPMNDPSLTNITEIDLSDGYKLWNVTVITQTHKYNVIRALEEMMDMIHRITMSQLELPQVKEVIWGTTNGTDPKKSPPPQNFDLMIAEFLFPTMMALSWRFDCPYIGVISLDATSYAHDIMGNPTNPVAYPDFQQPFTPPMTFFQRVYTVITSVLVEYYGEVFSQPVEDFVQDYFGNYPPLHELSENISMLFLNTNPIFHTIRPLNPSTIQIGGFLHINPAKPLPEELQTYLDEARDGFIYFSLGSNVKSFSVEPRLKDVLLQTFSILSYKILWKFDKALPDLPNNTKVIEWGPQQDILRHPNVKLFITQGGLQSIEEAMYFHVPLVVIPFFGDQFGNARLVADRGLGINLDKDDLTVEILSEVISEAIRNPKYKDTARKMTNLILDQPMTGIEKAVWWTEYVIRHKGAPHFRNEAYDMPLLQSLLLDVVAFLFAIFLTIFYILHWCVKWFLKKTIRVVKFKSRTKSE